jgi:hypothetical protein
MSSPVIWLVVEFNCGGDQLRVDSQAPIGGRVGDTVHAQGQGA